MSVDFKHSVDVRRDATDVFDYISDFENNPTWQAGMVACRWTSGQKAAAGSTYVQEAKFMGRRIETHFVVTEVEAGRSISIESTKSTFPIQVTRTVESLDGGRCRVTAHVRGQPTGVLKLFSGMVAKSVKKDYATLVRLLES